MVNIFGEALLLVVKCNSVLKSTAYGSLFKAVGLHVEKNKLSWLLNCNLEVQLIWLHRY